MNNATNSVSLAALAALSAAYEAEALAAQRLTWARSHGDEASASAAYDAAKAAYDLVWEATPAESRDAFVKNDYQARK